MPYFFLRPSYFLLSTIIIGSGGGSGAGLEHIWPMYDHIWSIYDHIRTIYEHIWAIHDQIWSINEHIWTIYNHVWTIYDPTSAICDHMWILYDRIRSIYDHIWCIYDQYGPYMIIYGLYKIIYDLDIWSYMMHMRPHVVSCLTECMRGSRERSTWVSRGV